MTFETFWAAVVATIEARTGEDLTKDYHIALSLSEVKELLRRVFEMGVQVGKDS